LRRLTLNNMNPEISTPSQRSFFIPAVVIALIILATIFAFYYLNQQKANRIATKPVQPIQNPAKNSVQTETISGQVVSLQDNLLTLKGDNGQEVQIKIAVGTSVIKQQWFDENSMGTVPAEVKAGDKISVQATKNSQGDKEAVSVVILVERSASQSAETKK